MSDDPERRRLEKELEKALEYARQAEDAAFKNGIAYFKERERAEQLAAQVPPPETKRRRGRPRGSGIDVLASGRELIEHYQAACVGARRQLTMPEFAARENVSVDTIRDRLRRFGVSWPPK